MAVTGLIFALFVFAHMYGNLKVLAGEQAFNTYAEHLRTIGEPLLPYAGFLWIMRIVLIVALLVHLRAAYTLWSRANKARSQKYAMKKVVAQSLSSKWMRWGGTFLLLFIIWHLLEFTLLKVDVSDGATQVENPYQLVVNSFGVPWLTLLYVVAMVALYMHLAHGVFSACQTLGWTPTVSAYRRAAIVAHIIAGLIVVGFLIPPLAILFGIVS